MDVNEILNDLRTRSVEDIAAYLVAEFGHGQLKICVRAITAEESIRQPKKIVTVNRRRKKVTSSGTARKKVLSSGKRKTI